jgi:hypothetical protein
MRRPKFRTAEFVPLVVAIDPAELSAAFASSRIAKMLASLQLPPALVELAVIVDVSEVMVLDAAVVSVVPVSFLAHAPIVTAMAVRAATLNLATTIVRPLPKIKKTASFI